MGHLQADQGGATWAAVQERLCHQRNVYAAAILPLFFCGGAPGHYAAGAACVIAAAAVPGRGQGRCPRRAHNRGSSSQSEPQAAGGIRADRALQLSPSGLAAPHHRAP